MRRALPPAIFTALLMSACGPAQEVTPPTAPLSPPTIPFTLSSTPTEGVAPSGISYPIVDTGQGKCYDNTEEIPCPSAGTAFFGQDAQYTGAEPRYQDNGDGTVSDLVTGLMWQQDPGETMTYDQAAAKVSAFHLAGHADWRLPSIKELYSLILFDGTDVSICNGTCEATPFLDTRYFHFSYGDPGAGERVIDSQFASATRYTSTTMNGNETLFGVNFADGRIKGYPTGKTFFVLYVRGNPQYGRNSFLDSGDGTITDEATGLIWMQADSGAGMDWAAALDYCEDLDFAGAADWRLPDIKELQSIVDYSRSPETAHSAAINPIFRVTPITDEAGGADYPFFWSSTTHADSSGRGTAAAYAAFGKALGFMAAFGGWVDVHGAGAQRSDPKSGAASEYPQGHGPQGDAVRVMNYVRCVRGGNAAFTPKGKPAAVRPTMTIHSTSVSQGQEGGSSGEEPPAEAIQACAGKADGAACPFDTPNGQVSGTCRWVQQRLACVPENRP